MNISEDLRILVRLVEYLVNIMRVVGLLRFSGVFSKILWDI